MMIKQILTICAALAAGSAGTSLALAQGYPVSPGPLYSTAPAPYQPGGYPSDYRRAPGAPDFDALEEDDDARNAQSAGQVNCVKPARAAKGKQGKVARVVTTFHRNAS